MPTSKKDLLYLQVKSLADKILITGEEPTVKNIYELLGGIGSRKQIAQYLERWEKERKKGKYKTSSDETITVENMEKLIEERTGELKKSLSLVRATLESTADGILMIDNKGRLIDWNQKFIEMANIPKDILEKGKERAGLANMLKQVKHPWKLVRLMIHLRLHPEEEGDVGEVLMKDGRIVERYSQPHRVGDQIVGRVWSFRDVTEQRKAEEALRLRERAIESSTHGVIIAKHDEHLTISYVNPAFEKITGYKANEILGKSISVLYGDDIEQSEIKSIALAVKEKREEKVILRCYKSDGSLFWNEMHLAPVPDAKGKIKHFVIILNDITERKAMEEQLLHQATHDALTDLPNRALLQDRLQQAINLAEEEKLKVMVLFLDLDRFKLVNDGLGHKMGDLLLNAVSERIRKCIRSVDTVARIGGDEFIIVLSHLDNIEEGAHIAQNILNTIRKPIQIQERELNITTSIGISCYPKDAEDPDTLLREADTAMYQAKDLGRDNFQFFTEEMNRMVSNRLVMENCLHRALENEEFDIEYQPIFNLKSGKVTSIEALLRWKNEKLGKVSPMEFIPMAEEMGLIVPIGEWVLKNACKQTVKWQKMGINDLEVSVNISGRQLKNQKIIETIHQALDETQLSPNYLVLEITENIVMDNTQETIERLQQIREMGVKLAIDDFGTGYSSLSYLKRLPVNKLKIDKTFISEVGMGSSDEAITLAIIAICKNLNLTVVAEGMQTKRQLDFLKRYKCDEVQGFYFSKPIDIDSCTRLLQENYGLLGEIFIDKDDT